MNVVVIKPGMLTTVQDRGRWGFQSSGVPVAGPMDPLSHRVANALVGNDADAATLEVTWLGPDLEFEDERVVAIAGADFSLTIEGRPMPSAAAFLVPAGARLRFGPRRSGARAYLAIAGGVAVPPVLGSRSTHVISAMGGMAGRSLRAGDRVPLGPASAASAVGAIPPPPEALSDGIARLRVMAGPQHEYFTDDVFETLCSASYTVAANSDRMGFRLEGPRLVHKGSDDIISDATPLGVLQVPASGQPILLMADRQTTGGYPKVATLITADLTVAGQLAPGDRVAFEICSAGDAMAALITQEQAILRLEAR
jgi:antagonist of KipI